MITILRQLLYGIHQYTFSGPRSVKLNKLMFNLSLRGLGVLNYQSSYLSGEADWVKVILQDIARPLVFDVGANVGKYIAHVCKVSPDAEVWAFEPHPKNVECLWQELDSWPSSRKALSCISIIQAAVGRKRGRLELYDRLECDGSSHASLYQGVIEDIHHAESTKQMVDVITLDEFCDERGIQHIDLLKIDTEGNELNCLLGAQKLLARGAIRAISFEFNEMNAVSHATFKDFWDLLDGYDIARLLPGGRLFPIKNYSPLYCEIYAYQNVVAVRRTES